MREENIVFDDYRLGKGFDISIVSEKGARSQQQDCAYALATDQDVLAMVCDGMGGMNGGEVASRTTIEAFLEYYQYFMKKESEISECLVKTVRAVDDVVYSLEETNGKRMGCGSTIAAICIHNKQLYWVSVGDSRIYILRNNELVQVTKDHNYNLKLQQDLKNKSIDEEKFRLECRNGEALISFVGMGGLTLIDVNREPFNLQKGDRLLLCTDGVYRAITEQEIYSVLEKQIPSTESSYVFVQSIKEKNKKNQDNYTLIEINIKE